MSTMEGTLRTLCVVMAYLLGSIPSAVIAGRRHGVDIRAVGDGNMGARNVTRMIGPVPGTVVAVCDFLKGVVAVSVAVLLQLPRSWTLAAAWAAIIGHDFPVFAQLRGGQGLATTFGCLFVLMPLETSVALGLFGALYLMTRNPDVSAGIGLGCGLLLAWWSDRPAALLAHAVCLLLFIPLKKMLDRRRRAAAQTGSC